MLAGAIYAGTWKGNSRCGVGRQVWKDGTVYEGEWKDNLPHGRGRFALANGDEYIGEWSAGLASGIGIFRSHNGTKYEGLWAGHTQVSDDKNTFGKGPMAKAGAVSYTPTLPTWRRRDFGSSGRSAETAVSSSERAMQ